MRTTNAHLGATKSFVRWAVEAEVMPADPIGTMARFKGKKADIRRVRRVLTAREIITLLRKTRRGPIREGMDGRERSLLYAFASQTGLRANEVRCLKVNDFDFDRLGGPVVKVRAAYSKTDEAAEQPLQPRLARKVKRFIQDRRKVGGAKVFGGAYKSLTVFTAQILREDLEAAGLEYETVDGYADFHSLRHVFTSSIRGVDDTVKMGLTRHATRAMLDTYDHADEDLALRRAALSQVKHWGKVG